MYIKGDLKALLLDRMGPTEAAIPTGCLCCRQVWSSGPAGATHPDSPVGSCISQAPLELQVSPLASGECCCLLCREKLLTGGSAVSGVSVLAGVFLSSSHEEVLKCKAELKEMDTVLRNSSAQEKGQELSDGVLNSTPPREAQVSITPATLQDGHHRRPRRESFSGRWLNPHLRRLYPFRRRSPESSAQEKGQELSDGVLNSTPPREAQVSITPATLQDGHHRRPRRESFSGRWLNPHLRRLYPFRRRSPESSAQEKGQELSDGVLNSTPPREAQVSITPATLQDGHHRRPRRESFSGRWLNPHLRRLYPFRRRSPESSAQEKGQELSDGVLNSTPPREAQVSITPATLQDGHHRRPRRESFSGRWLNPHLRRLYPFRRRSPESSAQEKGQELSDGVLNSTPPREAQVSITPATLQDGHHRRPRRESFSGRWLNPHLRRLYPFRRRSPESSAQEKGQELSDGVLNSTPPREAQVSITPATLQDGHHRRPRRESFSGRWLNPHLRRLYPFRRRSPESSAQEKGQELSDGVLNSTPPREAQVSITPATLQDGHHRRPRRESFSGRWLNPHLRRLYPFRRRSPESSAQEKGQELSDGVLNSTPPREAQVSITPATLQDGHHRRPRRESFSGRWLNPHLRRLYPFRRRSPESSAQEKGQELSDGVLNSTPPREAQVSITPATLQDGHHRRPRRESFSGRWLNPHLRRLYPFRRRSPESSAQEKGQELSDGVLNSTPPREAQVSITPATLQDGHHRRPRRESFSGRWLNPHLRRLYPFRRRSPESSAQEKGQELSDGVLNSTPPREAQVSITPATLQDGHHRRPRRESFSGRWLNPHLRRLYPFRRRSPESSAQEKGQELSDGVLNSTPPREAQVSITPATLQDGHHRRPRRESFSGRWLNPHLRRLYPFRRRSPESSAQEKGQELSDGVLNSTPPREAQVSITPATLQDGHHRRPRRESFSGRWLNPHLRRLYPFRRRSPESSAQEKGQELSDGVLNSTPPREAQVSITPATLQDGHHRAPQDTFLEVGRLGQMEFHFEYFEAIPYSFPKWLQQSESPPAVYFSLHPHQHLFEILLMAGILSHMR
ncbi:uncharacterized protein WM277_001055 [Molossus nigricans]